MQHDSFLFHFRVEFLSANKYVNIEKVKKSNTNVHKYSILYTYERSIIIINMLTKYNVNYYTGCVCYI